MKPIPTEAQIIVKMRHALDVLKAKYMEAEGSWALVEFMGAALGDENSQWVRQIVEAEQLSEPYMEKSKTP